MLEPLVLTGQRRKLMWAFERFSLLSSDSFLLSFSLSQETNVAGELYCQFLVGSVHSIFIVIILHRSQLCCKRGRSCLEKFGPWSTWMWTWETRTAWPLFFGGGRYFFFFFHGSHYWQPPVWRFPPIRTATTFSQAFKSLLVHLSSGWRGGGGAAGI